jgi:hypothetical protein
MQQKCDKTSAIYTHTLQFIVGDIGYAFNNDIGIFYDFIGKMYIETCFRLRSEVLSVTV